MQANTSGRQAEDIENKLENYCDYVDQFCIGRVISAADETFRMVKYLHQHSKEGVLYFLWPEWPDIDIKHNSYIFFRPVSSNRCHDYRINNNSDTIDISSVKLEIDAEFSHVAGLSFSCSQSERRIINCHKTLLVG